MAASEEPWWKTCDLYDFLGSWECTMTREEQDKYREEVLKPMSENHNNGTNQLGD